MAKEKNEKRERKKKQKQTGPDMTGPEKDESVLGRILKQSDQIQLEPIAPESRHRVEGTKPD
jgi:hypothetical protein